LALLAGGSLAHAQDTTDRPDPVVGKLEQRVTRFLERISEGDEEEAFADLLLGSQLAEQTSAIRVLVDRSKEIPDRYGPHQESEQIGTRRIGKDLVLMRYLYKCEKFPVVWYFSFYRNFSRQSVSSDDQWVIITVRFDTQVDLLFQ
jgi:hypothetical protein